MLTFLKVATRSILVAVAAMAADALVAYEMIQFGFSFVGIVGDMMLIEVAILFLIAGLIDFSSSIGAAQFRKTILGSKRGYSQSVHKEAERKAAVLLLAGVFILIILCATALLTHG
jgi:hypothetical protein